MAQALNNTIAEAKAAHAAGKKSHPFVMGLVTEARERSGTQKDGLPYRMVSGKLQDATGASADFTIFMRAANEQISAGQMLSIEKAVLETDTYMNRNTLKIGASKAQFGGKWSVSAGAGPLDAAIASVQNVPAGIQISSYGQQQIVNPAGQILQTVQHAPQPQPAPAVQYRAPTPVPAQAPAVYQAPYQASAPAAPAETAEIDLVMVTAAINMLANTSAENTKAIVAAIEALGTKIDASLGQIWQTLVDPGIPVESQFDQIVDRMAKSGFTLPAILAGISEESKGMEGFGHREAAIAFATRNNIDINDIIA